MQILHFTPGKSHLSAGAKKKELILQVNEYKR